MIRRFTIASIVVFALLIVTARAIGSTNKPPALAMLDPGDCPQPCWHGIRPGVTMVEEAKTILNTDSMFLPILLDDDLDRACWQTKPQYLLWTVCIEDIERTGAIVPEIYLWPPPDMLQLGDIINNFEQPLLVQPCEFIIGVDNIWPSAYWGVFLQQKSRISVDTFQLRTANEQIINPNMIVNRLEYQREPNSASHNWQMWQGFKPIVNGSSCAFFSRPLD